MPVSVTEEPPCRAAPARTHQTWEDEMKKLKLDMDDLRVDTFATEAADGKTGTVRGHDFESDTIQTQCTCVNTCQGYGCTPNRPCWF
jgi:hypothetical protein